MSNDKVTYNVNGRYMTGSEVVGYHLIGSDGSNLTVKRDKVILLTSRGLIENLRVQYNNDEVIIRGKGINLNNLPVYDLKTEKIRDTNKTVSEQLSKYNIIKRIMHNTTCVGYVLQDNTGKQIGCKRGQTIKYTLDGMVANATAQAYNDSTTGKAMVILRGVDCDLKKLPVIVVDDSGNCINTSKDGQEIALRATRSRRNGIIYNLDSNDRQIFESGDFIICTVGGELKVIKQVDASKYLKSSDSKDAICDGSTANLNKYQIQFVGSDKLSMRPDIISKWAIVNYKQSA